VGVCLGRFAHTGLWRPLTIAELAGSLFLDVLHFNHWFIFIGGVNAAFLWALVWAHWLAVSRVGPSSPRASLAPWGPGG